MRQAINENPLVQIAVLGGMAIVVAVVFMMQSGGGGEQAASPASTPAVDAAGAPAATTTVPADSATTTPAEPATATPSETPTSPSDAAPADVTGADGTGSTANGSATSTDEALPPEYVSATDSGETVAIFIVRGKPVSDKAVSGYAGRLDSSGQAQVFVVKPAELAEWVRVVGPVGVDRTPALVVVEPGTGGAEPTAAVSYGFRNYESVEQAVKDAKYDGPVRGYDPD